MLGTGSRIPPTHACQHLSPVVPSYMGCMLTTYTVSQDFWIVPLFPLYPAVWSFISNSPLFDWEISNCARMQSCYWCQRYNSTMHCCISRPPSFVFEKYIMLHSIMQLSILVMVGVLLSTIGVYLYSFIIAKAAFLARVEYSPSTLILLYGTKSYLRGVGPDHVFWKYWEN